MGTNILIDDELMTQAMTVSGIKTKKAVVEQAIREFIEKHTRKDISDLFGSISFADDYDYKMLRGSGVE